ncbi:SDR family oxidoreductase [Arthrobacter sulfonylureivorans]|uniref:SDR family oxidoreductase n=1 Tax=Arthrobacter sulfonylureivorans TaxID=2486855 RepID=A0ABY3WBY7_9MICC|nr:SDR family oxidoreductase [Arthrobacter sulfonylureivorans]UNK47877.1 SDR family oxidoreductase [Arthrobacter sulfonylureivorans]
MTGARLDGRTALITGASAGIGRATALALAEAGAALIVTGRREAQLRIVAEECEAQGAKVWAVTGDLNDPAFVRRLADAGTGVDILVNNAGVLTYAPILETPLPDSEAMFQTNVLSALRLIQAIGPAMVKRKRGHIVMMSSTAAREVYRLGAVYCASKHAMSALTRGLRLELQANGIKVTEVAPGIVDTGIRSASDHPDVMAAREAAGTVLSLTAKDVAAAVVYALTAPEDCCPDLIELRPRGAATG